jgi:hypothetical protein
MPPTSLAQDILSDHQEPCAARNHGIPLSLRRKQSPKLDPMGNHMNNLQEIKRGFFVKNNEKRAIWIID